MSLEILIAQGLLKVDPTGHIEPINKNIRASKQLTKRHLPDLIKMFFKLQHEYNCYILQCETISKRGYGLAMDAFEKFLIEIGNVTRITLEKFQ